MASLDKQFNFVFDTLEEYSTSLINKTLNYSTAPKTVKGSVEIYMLEDYIKLSYDKASGFLWLQIFNDRYVGSTTVLVKEDLLCVETTIKKYKKNRKEKDHYSSCDEMNFSTKEKSVLLTNRYNHSGYKNYTV